MTTLTLNIDLADETGIQRAITALQRLLGNASPAPAPAGAAGAGTAKTGAARGGTGAAPTPAAASAQPQQPGSTAATGEAGNGTSAGSGAPASQGAAAGAQSSGGANAAGAPVQFDELKKAFLNLSTKADGRAKCEGVLKPFGLAKLSEAKPEQYPAILAAIKQASA
jgi:hypothetical protein